MADRDGLLKLKGLGYPAIKAGRQTIRRVWDGLGGRWEMKIDYWASDRPSLDWRRVASRVFAGGEAVGFSAGFFGYILRHPFDPDIPCSFACTATAAVGIVMGLGYFSVLGVLRLRAGKVAAEEAGPPWLVAAWSGGSCGGGIVAAAVLIGRYSEKVALGTCCALTVVLPVLVAWFFLCPSQPGGSERHGGSS
jgi:hypothetical protein